jgi:hypothetical protein
MARRWIPITIVATIVAGLAIAVVSTLQMRRTLETPAYTTLSEQVGFEIRRYDPRVVAEVVVPGKPDEAANEGFQILADYIFGNNASKTEIAMTTPVERTPEGDAWKITFTMPSQFILATLPQPNDERIELREIPTKTYAVKRFAGAPRAGRVEARTKRFLEDIDRSGFQVAGTPPTFARFDPPWTLPFLRRNEILVELAGYY